MSRRSSDSGAKANGVHKLDFDAHRQPRTAHFEEHDNDDGGSRATTRNASSSRSLLRDDVSLLSEVVDGIVEQDRRRLRKQIVRCVSFAGALLQW